MIFLTNTSLRPLNKVKIAKGTTDPGIALSEYYYLIECFNSYILFKLHFHHHTTSPIFRGKDDFLNRF